MTYVEKVSCVRSLPPGNVLVTAITDLVVCNMATNIFLMDTISLEPIKIKLGQLIKNSRTTF